MITISITEQAVKQEWSKILKIAHNKGFREQVVHQLRNKIHNQKGITRANAANATTPKRIALPSRITVPQYVRSPIYSNAII